MIKGYLLVVLSVVPVSFVYGLLVPWLVSAQSDLALLIGFVSAFGFPIVGFIVGSRYINSLKKSKGNN